MKIGFLTQWYEPETGSAAHPTAIARALRERGHEVKVLTAFPSYPQGIVHSGYRMSWRADEVRDGMIVRRIADVPSHDASPIRRALSLLSFAVSATWHRKWLADCDVVLTYLSPATVGLASWSLRRRRGVPYVLYVQDLWPETVTASGFIGSKQVTRFAERVINRALRGLYRHASGVVAISPSMATTLAGRGCTQEPVSIPNWVDETVFTPAGTPAATDLDPGVDWFMYAGGMGELQGLEMAVQAMTLLRERRDLGFVFVGEGVTRPSIETLVQERGLEDRVRFLGSRPMEEMPALMALAVAQLVSLKDLPLFRTTVPSKIQASMACAAPVICAVAGDAAQIVEEARAGLVVQPESPEELAEAMVMMAAMSQEERRAMGQQGRRYYEERLSTRAGAERLDSVLATAVGSGEWT